MPSAFADRQLRYPDLLAYPGWDDLMQSQLAWGFDCGPGWLSLIDTTLEALDLWRQRNLAASIRVRQIKEKFGRLAIYVDTTDVAPSTREAVLRLLSEVADRSAHTCEQCGQPGQCRSTGGWWHTVCDACEAAWQARQEPFSVFRQRMGLNGGSDVPLDHADQ